MRKFITLIILSLFAVTLFAQEYNKNESIIVTSKNKSTIKELYSKIVNEYGMNNIKFVKLVNGNYVPVTSSDIQKTNEVQIDQDVITIFAIIGAILVAIIVLRAIFWYNYNIQIVWEIFRIE